MHIIEPDHGLMFAIGDCCARSFATSEKNKSCSSVAFISGKWKATTLGYDIADPSMGRVVLEVL